VRGNTAGILVLALSLVMCGTVYAEETAIDGTREYTEGLRISPGEVVRVAPGTLLRFAPGRGIKVEGVLEVNGTLDKPVTLEPSGDGWAGIASAPGGNVRMKNVIISRADEAVKMSGGVLTMKYVTVLGGGDGVVLETMADAEMKSVSFSAVSNTSLTLRQGSRASVSSSGFNGPGKTGIKMVGKCSLDVEGAEIAGFGTGVRTTYPGSRPGLHGCVVSGNQYGLYSEYPDSGAVVSDCDLTGNEYGVYAKRMSSPEVAGSRVTDNSYGIYATEGATPRVSGSLISGNGYGVYVTFSSYPVVNGCELSGNREYAVYLDEQSYDWVKSTGDDTRRERMGMRAAASAGSGGESNRERGMSAERYVNPKGGFVDFSGNYWGPETTGEMERADGLADTKVVYDYFDLNTDIYDGKRWVRDKADYSGFLKESPLGR